MEIQVNGGSVADKVAFAKELLEKDVPVDTVFSKVSTDTSPPLHDQLASCASTPTPHSRGETRRLTPAGLAFSPCGWCRTRTSTSWVPPRATAVRVW